MMNKCASYFLASSVVFLATTARAQETTTYTYDALGRLVESSTTGSVNNGLATSIGYDPAGNRSSYSVSGAGGTLGLLPESLTADRYAAATPGALFGTRTHARQRLFRCLSYEGLGRSLSSSLPFSSSGGQGSDDWTEPLAEGEAHVPGSTARDGTKATSGILSSSTVSGGDLVEPCKGSGLAATLLAAHVQAEPNGF